MIFTQRFFFSSLFTVKPRIDRTNLNPVIVKAGLSLSLDIKIIGEPPPEVCLNAIHTIQI